MRIKDLGEFGLIERISRLLPPYLKDVMVGVGDDVAVVETEGDNYLLLTCDIQVENTHFLPSASPHQLGRKAAAVNLSDIGAKGGKPLHFLISLALRAETPVEWADNFYQGLVEEASRYGADIIGGNLSSIQGPQVVDIFLAGQVRKDRLLLRKGARPGDLILVTGQLGDARGGLLLLTQENLKEKIDPQKAKDLIQAQVTPTPRVKEGQIIAHSGKATAMLDISDGLAQDLLHICQASEAGARIWADRIPLSSALGNLAQFMEIPPWKLALEGGEDYELCFTVPEAHAQEVSQRIEEATGTRVTVIGETLQPQEGQWVIPPRGEKEPLNQKGWNHFREGREGWSLRT